MAYDEELAERIRAVLADRTDVSERRMFGGLAFLVDGHMAAAAAGSAHGMMLRCHPDDTQEHLVDGAEPMVMRGRELSGWLLLPIERLTDRAALERWLDIAIAYVQTLPPK